MAKSESSSTTIDDENKISIKNLEFDQNLNPETNGFKVVFLGKNEVGKTAFLKAVLGLSSEFIFAQDHLDISESDDLGLDFSILEEIDMKDGLIEQSQSEIERLRIETYSDLQKLAEALADL